MSLEYIVVAGKELGEVETPLIEQLAKRGFTCELQPSVKLADRSLEDLWFRVSALPATATRKKPGRDLIACVGIERLVRPPSALVEAEPAVASATDVMNFRSTSGASRLETALQLLCAAIVAKETEGVFFDPQHGEVRRGHAAIEYAAAEVARRSPIFDIREREFSGWAA